MGNTEKMTGPAADIPAHAVVVTSATVGGVTYYGHTPDEWVVLAALFSVAGVIASLAMYGLRFVLALRESSRRDQESKAYVAAQNRIANNPNDEEHF